MLNYFKCAVCEMDCSGERSFISHLSGRGHVRKNGGRAGFAGLMPNKLGVIPAMQVRDGKARRGRVTGNG